MAADDIILAAIDPAAMPLAVKPRAHLEEDVSRQP